MKSVAPNDNSIIEKKHKNESKINFGLISKFNLYSANPKTLNQLSYTIQKNANPIPTCAAN